jgi:hypothetical protein
MVSGSSTRHEVSSRARRKIKKLGIIVGRQIYAEDVNERQEPPHASVAFASHHDLPRPLSSRQSLCLPNRQEAYSLLAKYTGLDMSLLCKHPVHIVHTTDNSNQQRSDTPYYSGDPNSHCHGHQPTIVDYSPAEARRVYATDKTVCVPRSDCHAEHFRVHHRGATGGEQSILPESAARCSLSPR